VITRRSGGGHTLNSRSGHIADPIDRHAGRVGRAPGQHDLVSGGNSGRRGRKLCGRRGRGGRRRLRGRERFFFLLATGNCKKGCQQNNWNQNAIEMFQDPDSFNRAQTLNSQPSNILIADFVPTCLFRWTRIQLGNSRIRVHDPSRESARLDSSHPEQNSLVDY